MKKLLIFAFLCFLVQTAFSQNPIGFGFRVSKPYCVFNFMQSATGNHSTSSTLQQLIAEKTNGNHEFKQLCNRFKEVRLDYRYTREEFPDNRRQTRTTFDLITIALVNSSSFNEFGNRIVGILPNEETKKFLDILTEAETHYDALIWKENETKMTAQLEALEQYSAQCSEIFSKIKTFYHSGWSSEIPFVVAIYPIPGNHGNTTATPHANSLCVGVLTDETDYIGRVGVVLHEMCHVLYDEQPAAFQHTLDEYFRENTSKYKQFAYNFIDEGLATALGNGWAFENLSGKPDPSDWYNNEYINGFGKALFPLVKEYLAADRAIDKEFVDKAIDLFAATFPNSISDYGILLNRSSIYCDKQTPQEMDALVDRVGKYFQLTSFRLSSPILDPTSLEGIKKSKHPQFIIVDSNNAAVLKVLKKQIPELKKVQIPINSLVSFLDSNNRAIILLNASNDTEVEKLLSSMKEMKYFDRTKIVQ